MSVTRHCTCILIECQDGFTLGFTDLDVPVTVAGQVYDPHGGFDASSVETRIGVSVDSLDAKGFISDERITEADVRAGRYSGAAVSVSTVDWSSGVVVQAFPEYVIADVKIGSVVISVTLENAAALQWQRQNGATLTSNCRHIFGDAACGVTAVPVAATITATDGATWIETDAPNEPETGIWRGGAVEVGGVTLQISHNEGSRLTFYRRIPHATVAVGGAVTLRGNCDKSFAMCAAFENRPNFGGFPHMPGEDANLEIIRQGDGTAKNGGSIFL